MSDFVFSCGERDDLRALLQWMGTRKAYVGDQGTVTVWTKAEERVARVTEMVQDHYAPDPGGDDAGAQRRADEAAEAAIAPTGRQPWPFQTTGPAHTTGH